MCNPTISYGKFADLVSFYISQTMYIYLVKQLSIQKDTEVVHLPAFLLISPHPILDLIHCILHHKY